MATTHRYFRYFTYIQPIIKTPFIKTYGSLILTIVALSIFTIFAIKPTIETILILQKTLNDQTEILSAINKKSQDLSLGSNNYKSLVNQGLTDKINTAVPYTPAVGELTGILETVSKVPQASISAIQFQPFTINPPSELPTFELSEISFTINVEGSYQSLLALLNNLRNAPRLISIDNITFNKLESSGLLLSVSGKAFYLK